jgi:hypothetical protein
MEYRCSLPGSIFHCIKVMIIPDCTLTNHEKYLARLRPWLIWPGLRLDRQSGCHRSCCSGSRRGGRLYLRQTHLRRQMRLCSLAESNRYRSLTSGTAGKRMWLFAIRGRTMRWRVHKDSGTNERRLILLAATDVKEGTHVWIVKPEFETKSQE